MFSVKCIVRIIILVLMLTSSIILFSILLLSAFSDWEVRLLTNVFGEGLLELALFFIAVVGGAVLLYCYLKRIALRKKANGEL